MANHSVQAIASHNGISNPDFIYPGQQLRIPKGNSTPGPVSGPDGVTPGSKLGRTVRTAMDYAQSLVGAPYSWWTDSSEVVWLSDQFAPGAAGRGAVTG